jgi:hypothetical protein
MRGMVSFFLSIKALVAQTITAPEILSTKSLVESKIIFPGSAGIPAGVRD